MSKETQKQHLAGAIAVATEALQHLERGSVVAVKYDEGAAMEVEGPARVTFKLEVEALDVPLRNKTSNNHKLCNALRVTKEAREEILGGRKVGALTADAVRQALVGAVLWHSAVALDSAVAAILSAQKDALAGDQ